MSIADGDQFLENRSLFGFVLAVVEIRVGKETKVDDVEILVAGVPKRGRHRVGEAVACDRARLESDDRRVGATPTMPTPLTGAAMVVATWVP